MRPGILNSVPPKRFLRTHSARSDGMILTPHYYRRTRALKHRAWLSEVEGRWGGRGGIGPSLLPLREQYSRTLLCPMAKIQRIFLAQEYSGRYETAGRILP